MSTFQFNMGSWHHAEVRVIKFRHTWKIDMTSLENGFKTSPLFAAEGFINRKFQMQLMKTTTGVAMKMRGEPATVRGLVDYSWKCFLLNSDGESICAIEQQRGRIVQLFEDDPASFEIKNDILQSLQTPDTLSLICEIYMTVSGKYAKPANVSNPKKVIQFIKNGSTYKELKPVELAVSQEDKLHTCKHQEELTKLTDQLDMICKTIQPLVSAHRENLKNMDHEKNSSIASNLLEKLENITAIVNNSKKKSNHNECTNHEEATSSTVQRKNVPHATDPETPNNAVIQKLLLGIISKLRSMRAFGEEQPSDDDDDDDDDTYNSQIEYDRSIVSEMLELIRTGQSSNIDRLILNTLQATVRYDLTPLRIICESILLHRSLNADSVVPTLILADRVGSMDLKKRAIKYIRANVYTVVYKENWSDLNERLLADIFQCYEE